jgi:branched-subunit amino acid ABC-type transport system permease component
LEAIAILTFSADVRAVGFVALFVMLILRPEGLLGRQVRERV